MTATTGTTMVAKVTGFRLSPRQRSVWLHPGGRDALVQCAVGLSGPLDGDRLRRALERAVGRHGALRTSFRSRPGMTDAVQVVEDAPELDWRMTGDAGAADGTPGEAREWMARERARRRRVADAAGPPLSALLVRRAALEHLLILTLPALCADRATPFHLVEELVAGYDADGGGDAQAAAGEDGGPVQYVQFAEWRNHLATAQEEAPGRDHWRRRDLVAPRTTLPYQAPADPAGSGAVTETRVLALSAAEAARLDDLAEPWGGGAEDVLLTAWAVTAGRLAESAEVVLGLACDGRLFPEVEDACGPFTRTVPLALLLPRGLAGGDAVRRTVRAVEEAEEWQGHLPAEARSETFPLAFEAVRVPAPASAGGVTFRVAGDALSGDPSPLRLVVRRRAGDDEGTDGEALTATVTADGASLDAAAAAVLARQVRRVVETLAEAPDSPLEALVRLPEEDRRHRAAALAPEPSGTPRPVVERGVVERVMVQVAAHPDAPALAAGGSRRTYGQLGGAVERVARWLRAKGIGPEHRVVLDLERSPEAVAALLGVLRAGAAYVPLDPALPLRRRQGFAAVARPAAWIAATEPAEELLPPDVPVLRLDREPLGDLLWQPADGAPEPVPAVDGACTAYLLFTSGSTGEPKAVAVERRHLAAYVAAVEERLELEPGAVYGLVSTLAADLGNTALFPALCGGGCLWIAGAEEAADPRAFAASLAASLPASGARAPGLDCLKIVPSHLASLLAGSEAAAVLPRRVLVLGGEAAPPRLLDRVRELAPACRVLNHYGPTETTVGVSVHEVAPPEAGGGAAPPPLGRPLAPCRLHLVDGALEPVPVGAPGEIVVGGGTVARGYAGRPAATAERFVPDPFAAEPGARLYRTGDLARWTPAGELHFVGRRDGQVKVRGFRVETGEVRAALIELPGVRDAWVAPVEEAGGVALAAWLVSGGGPAPQPADLRGLLARRLPAAMVPARFATLPALPLGPNGKVDAAALPEPGREPVAVAATAPRHLGEEMVADLWRELLGLDEVGARDDFFALGGHSLLATQLASRLRRAFGVELPLAALFEEPTVEGVVRRVAEAKAGGAGAVPALPPLERAARRDELPLSFAQERLWLVHELEGPSAAYNIPVALRLRGPLSVPALVGAVEGVVRRHEVLRTAFVSRDGAPRQRVLPAVPVAVPVVDLGRLEEADRETEAARLAHREAARLFDLGRPPLLRGRLLRHRPAGRDGSGVHDALLTLHHVVSDGWSKGILVQEVEGLYAAHRAGVPSALPELPVQYGDFAAWQREWLRGDVLEAEVRYWRQALAGVPQALELPFEGRRRGGGATVPFSLPRELTAGLRRLARAEGATLFMVLLAGLQALLHRLTGKPRIAVGTDVANRVPAEVEELVGFFVNHLVLPADLGDDPPFRELLGRVREQTLGAYDHQHLPFDRLVQALRAERVAGRNPLFQVLLVLQNHARRDLALDGLEVEALPSGLSTSKFDLALFLGERDGALEGSWSHRAGSRAEVEALGRKLEHLLADAVARPEAPVRSLRLASGEERAVRRRRRVGRLREVQEDLAASET